MLLAIPIQQKRKTKYESLAKAKTCTKVPTYFCISKLFWFWISIIARALQKKHII